LFFAEPIPVLLVRSVLLFLVQRAERIESVTIEVFPKQIGERPFGNLCKIPLGIHQKTRRRCLFVRSDFSPHPHQWDVLAGVRLISQMDLEQFRQRHQVEMLPPPPSTNGSTTGRFGLPCVTAILEQGAREGCRDEATFVLACNANAWGLPEDLARDLLNAWNLRNDPPLLSEEIERKIQSAYEGDYPPYPCQRIALDSYCDSKCRFFAEKMRSRGRSFS